MVKNFNRTIGPQISRADKTGGNPLLSFVVARDYFINMLTERATSVYFWDFSKSDDEDLLNFYQSQDVEKMLLNHKYVAVYKVGSLIIEPCTACKFNKLKQPILFKTLFTNTSLSHDNAVIMFNEHDNTTLSHVIYMYANKLASIEMSKQQLIKLAKFPFIFKANEYTKTEMLNVFNKLDNFDVALFTDKQELLDGDGIKVFDLGIDLNKLKQLNDEYQFIMQQFNQIIGITAIDHKKERMITDEVQSINMLADLNMQHKLKNRQVFCNKIFKKFGVKIECELMVKDEN